MIVVPSMSSNWSALPLRRLLAVVGACIAVLAVGASQAQADFGFIPGSAKADAFDANGDFETQAGAHPFAVTTEFKLNTRDDGAGFEIPDMQVRDVEVDLPQGFAGNPQALPRCSWAHLNAMLSCPLNTQVGVANVDWFPVNPPRGTGFVAVYNMEPTDGHVAEFGFQTSLGINQLVATVRPGDNGIRIRATRIPQGGPVFGVGVTLWGVPGDPAHDADRGRQCQSGWEDVATRDIWCPAANNPYVGPVKPFLTNPTACNGPLTTKFRARSWANPDVWESITAISSAVPDGCERLRFEPTMSAQPDVRTPDSPTGLEVKLNVPQTYGPNELATSTLRDAKVTLPEGMTVNPSSADGLGACSDAELALQSESDPTCPNSSKIGTLSVDTPLLPAPLTGSVYLGRQTANQLMRLFLVLKGQGLLVKIPGRVDPDPVTGQLVTTFEDSPQLPFTSLELRLNSGPRAPLATPPTCGVKTTFAELTPWSGGPTVTVSDSFTVDCPGITGFSPTFEAGGLRSEAGRFSPFAVRIERQDRQQYLDGVTLDLPGGLLARLKGVPLCPSDQMAAGTCAAGSRVGSATVGSGPGPHPFYLKSQPVYLGGPYKGAPYSLSVASRVIAGPLDLGTVVVRQALRVDPEDAHVTVESDPLPTIVEGVPLRLRGIYIDVDRPGFTLNPTSCAQKQIRATLHSQQGSISQVVAPFRASDCAALGFTPKLGMRLVGRNQMHSGGHPVLRAVLTQGSGQANVRAAKVTLPQNVVLDSRNSVDPKLLCGYDASLKADCPASSIIGEASLQTPLLDRPLSGPVHFVQGIRFENGNRIRSLPTLLVKLRGEVAIDLRSTTAVDSKDRLVSKFPNVPDARAGKFSLQINGGRKGILVVTENRRGRINLCNRRQTALVETDGHNGKRADYPVRVKTSCARKGKRRR